jgi:hypothetical protein
LDSVLPALKSSARLMVLQLLDSPTKIEIRASLREESFEPHRGFDFLADPPYCLALLLDLVGHSYCTKTVHCNVTIQIRKTMRFSHPQP